MSELVSGLVLLGAYVGLVILARWICIARTNMLWTRAQAMLFAAAARKSETRST